VGPMGPDRGPRDRADRLRVDEIAVAGQHRLPRDHALQILRFSTGSN